MTPLLSIYVPTYNRAGLLEQSLYAILSQITPQMAREVEVVVADNASPDGTPQVVARAQADFPHICIQHLRRPENIGCDRNFCEAPNSVSGLFVYILSDDDILLPGAVARLLELIVAYPDFDAFSLNVRLFTWDPSEAGTPEVYKLAEDKIIRGRDEMLLLLKAHIIFISCLAFRRENAAGRDYTDRRDTNMGQSYMFLDVLTPGRGVYVTRQPYLAQRTDNAVGYNFFRVWVTNFAALMRHAQQIGYSPLVIRQIMDSNLRFLFHYTLVFKRSGQYGELRPRYPDALLRLLRTYGLNGYLWTRIIPVLLTPRPALGLLRRLYRKLKSLRPGQRAQNPREDLLS